jgi:hypothetical protein
MTAALMLQSPAAAKQIEAAAQVQVRHRWPKWLALWCFAQYAFVGIWLMKVQDVLLGDSVNRTINAQTMLLSRDPHLGAMGFYWMPLPMFARLPFVLILKPFNEVILSGPLSSAVLAALVVPVLARIGYELGLRTPLIVVIVLTYAFGGTTLTYATNGMSEAAFALFIALSLHGVVRYHLHQDVHRLAATGFALAGGLMSRFEFIPLTVMVIFACLLVTPRSLWRQTAATIGIPPLFVFVLWTLASSLIKGDALYWYHAARVAGTTPDDHPWMPDVLTAGSILGYVAWATVVVCPLLALIFVFGVLQRNGRRGAIGIGLAALSMPAFVAFQLLLKSSYGTPRYFSLMPVFGAVLAMWVIAHATEWRPKVRQPLIAGSAALLVVGAVAPPFVYDEKDMAPVDQEWVLYSSITRGEATRRGTFLSGLESLIGKLDPELAEGKIAALDTEGGIPLVLSRHPRSFIVPEDRDFEQIMADPSGRFDYAIVMKVDFRTGSTGAIKDAMARVEGGRFELLEDFGAAELWHFVADPEG